MRISYLSIFVSVLLLCVVGKASSQASPDLAVSPRNYDWGVISNTGQAMSHESIVTNNSQYVLNLTKTGLVTGKDFSITGDTCGATLGPSQACQITATPSTESMGSHSDDVALSDSNNQTLSIGLSAIVELENGFGWGTNSSGQVGDGQIADSLTVTALSGGIRFQEMSAGANVSCGLNYHGTPFCWGSGGDGALGNGTNTSSLTPVAVSGNYTFSWISVGASHACGIITCGATLCWGNNSSGQLGTGAPCHPQYRSVRPAPGPSTPSLPETRLPAE